MVCEVIFLLAVLCLRAARKAIIQMQSAVARQTYHHNTDILDPSNYGNKSILQQKMEAVA